jgi:hypothetical protein
VAPSRTKVWWRGIAMICPTLDVSLAPPPYSARRRSTAEPCGRRSSRAHERRRGTNPSGPGYPATPAAVDRWRIAAVPVEVTG